MAGGFFYCEAFWWQEILRTKIAIAGMGGVGGVHLPTLVRLGIEAFNVTDFDVFYLVNFNRQAVPACRASANPKPKPRWPWPKT